MGITNLGINDKLVRELEEIAALTGQSATALANVAINDWREVDGYVKKRRAEERKAQSKEQNLAVTK